MTNDNSNNSDSGAVATSSNFVLTFRTNHPKNRVSYGVAGVTGIVVFDLNLFADGVAPPTITIDAELKAPKVASTTAKAEAAAVRAAEKLAKAQAKADAAAAKLAEKAAKAQAALDKAQAKVDAAAKVDAPPAE